ncbi:hypothetical protein FRB95_013770 [Tulasnella sp. JGI-2019a]|nr:hypothetical protein FRB95_013770 [Tulasnella sp. JGI-2019a]
MPLKSLNLAAHYHINTNPSSHMFSSLILLALAAFASARPFNNSTETLSKRATTNAVYAHFIVGIVGNYQEADWKNDFTLAQATGIDGFALNIGLDSWTATQLSYAYTVANQVGFKLFISFDFAASPGYSDYVNQIVPILKAYLPNGASAQYAGKPIVSTFSGDSFTSWPAVRALVPAFELIPFVQAANIAAVGADGALQWNAWPSSNNAPVDTTMTTAGDTYYQQVLAGKPYMAGVSPWFYTHYSPSSYNKNWLYLSDTLLIDRWNEMLGTVKPQLIELLTWNDFGESHYIGPLHPTNTAVYAGNAGAWVTGMPHDGWRRIIQSYITAYKAGTAPVPTSVGESVVMWYRPNPKGLVCSDAVGPPTGYTYPADSVWAAALLNSAATLQICSGGKCASAVLPAGVNYFSGPFGAGQPTFTLTRSGVTLLSGTGGLSINTVSCTTYNFNAYVQAWP